MAQGAVVNLQVPHGLSEAQLTALRERMPVECGLPLDDFYCDGPLVPEPDEWAMPVQDGVSRWYRANLYKAFWSPKYPRGEPELIARVAAWLEANVPGGDVWYGHDGADFLTPFGPDVRAEMLSLWKQGRSDSEWPSATRDEGHE